MSRIELIKSRLLALANQEKKPIFYKTSIGNYAEHDQFLNINVPILRKFSEEFSDLSKDEIQIFIESPFNEERLLALFILIIQYQKPNHQRKEELYQFYMNNLKYVNNWNLVDASAHHIIGAYLFTKEKEPLFDLARSPIMWERRISIVASWYFIRKRDLYWTFEIALLLLNDNHDLIQKAVGWMLREAGKRNEKKLMDFLDKNGTMMPRTMLRYAIEKFPDNIRKEYLKIR